MHRAETGISGRKHGVQTCYDQHRPTGKKQHLCKDACALLGWEGSSTNSSYDDESSHYLYPRHMFQTSGGRVLCMVYHVRSWSQHLYSRVQILGVMLMQICVSGTHSQSKG